MVATIIRTSILVLVMLLAGCTDTPLDAPMLDGEDAGDDGEPTAADGIPAPSWSTGDYWTFALSVGGTITFIVTDDLETDWEVRTSDPELAFDEAFGTFDPSSDVSFLGAIRKSDLAGSQGGDRVRHYDFPLVAGNEWSTRWDGADRTVRVTSVDGGTATLEAVEEGRKVADYAYSRDAGWTSSMRWYTPEGELALSTQLVDYGSNFTGELPSWTFSASRYWYNGAGSASSSTFEVPEDATDVWLHLMASCAGPGQAQYAIGPPQGLATGNTGGYEGRHGCPHEIEVRGGIGSEPRGQWGYVVAAGTAEWTLDLTYSVRTLTMEPFGPPY